MRGQTFATVEDYLSGVEGEPYRQALEDLRRIIREEVPNAQEVISYGMPGYKLNGYLCGFAAFKGHCSFFPGGIAEQFADRLPGFKTAKGLRFGASTVGYIARTRGWNRKRGREENTQTAQK